MFALEAEEDAAGGEGGLARGVERCAAGGGGGGAEGGLVVVLADHAGGGGDHDGRADGDIEPGAVGEGGLDGLEARGDVGAGDPSREGFEGGAGSARDVEHRAIGMDEVAEDVGDDLFGRIEDECIAVGRCAGLGPGRCGEFEIRPAAWRGRASGQTQCVGNFVACECGHVDPLGDWCADTPERAADAARHPQYTVFVWICKRKFGRFLDMVVSF